MRPIATGAIALSLIGGTAVFAAGQKLGEVQAQRTPEELYPRTCGYCHGHNVGPIIRGRQLPAELVAMMVRQGQGAMPAFRPTEISPGELDALSRWIETSKPDVREQGQ